MGQRILIVGGAVAGPAAAVSARATDKKAEIMLLERAKDVGFATGGLAFYLGGEVRSIKDLAELPAERLRAQRIPTLLVRTDHLDDVPRLARLLASLAGRAAVGDSLARWFYRELDSATVAPSAEPPSVLILAWDQPPIAIGAGSFLSELLQRAGARNVFADLQAPSAPVSLEAIASRSVDAILVMGDSVPAWAARAEWQSVEAVHDGRFIRVPADLFSRPGPRSPAALRALVAALGAGAPA